MTTGANDFYYSNKYEDDEYEYRHVHVTKVHFSSYSNYKRDFEGGSEEYS